MRPDLFELETEALASVEAGRRLGTAARAGRASQRFGSASVEVGADKGYALGYLIEVFMDEIKSWVRAEGYGWGDWIVRPMEHRELCVFSVLDPARPETVIEYALEYAVERCVTSGDLSIDGGLMGRVDSAAMEELGAVA